MKSDVLTTVSDKENDYTSGASMELDKVQAVLHGVHDEYVIFDKSGMDRRHDHSAVEYYNAGKLDNNDLLSVQRLVVAHIADYLHYNDLVFCLRNAFYNGDLLDKKNTYDGTEVDITCRYADDAVAHFHCKLTTDIFGSQNIDPPGPEKKEEIWQRI